MDTMLPSDTIDLQSIIRLPNNKVRNLRVCLSNLKMNILPSERKMQGERAPRVSHVNVNSVDGGLLGLRRTKHDDVTPCPFLNVKDIKSFIEEITIKDTDVFFIHDLNFNNKWWLLFSGDKGGQHMKYHGEIINSIKAWSVDNVHIYCMFEAADSIENMVKVWHPYRAQVKMMMEDNFKLNDGRSVEVFLGGDYHFLDDNMGHHGSSLTYPSSLDKVTLYHLQHHGGLGPQIPLNCQVEARNVKDYLENYNGNLADHRHNNNMHENGKYHNSVVCPMIFPVRVPASLHIMMGIVLLIYNLLLEECKRIDVEEGVK